MEDRRSGSRASAWQSALRLLARRNHSEAELMRKLRQRGYAEQEIQEALARCHRYRYVDDAQTAMHCFEEWVGRGDGPLRIQWEMQRRGLPEELIREHLAAYQEPAAECAAAQRLLDRRGARFEREADPRRRREKIYRFLSYRGYGAEAIRHALEQWERNRQWDRDDPDPLFS